MRRKTKGLIEIYALDASVVIKWFKKGEEHESEALRLRDSILSSKISALTSEWLLLEVVRALVKVNYPDEKIEEAFATLKEITSLGFIESVAVGKVLEKAKEMEVRLSLFASDSIYLATALSYNAVLVTEDRHLLKKEVSDYAKDAGIKIMSLKEIFGD
jgi:predicted nucleic acid-binding protein